MAERRKTTKARPDLDARIVDAAIALAEEVGWENVRLRTVAERLGVSLADVARHYRDLDAIADAWFARARLAMVAPVEPGFWDLPAHERLRWMLMRWFDALRPHRKVTVEMLRLKMWPFHPHHWVPMVFNLSRTILWLRDSAGLDAPAPRREVEEVGLTWLFLFTLAVWSCDGSDDTERTRRFLGRRLAQADALMAALFPRRRAGASSPAP